jgi:hypothetical protein
MRCKNGAGLTNLSHRQAAPFSHDILAARQFPPQSRSRLTFPSTQRLTGAWHAFCLKIFNLVFKFEYPK